MTVNRLSKKYFFKTLACCFLCLFSLDFVSSDTSLNQTKFFCNVLNQQDAYSRENLIQLQSFFQQTYFPQIIVTGRDDLQTKRYIAKFQHAFGLKESGKLDSDTLRYIRKKYNCSNIEDKIINYRDAPPKRIITSTEVLQNLIKEFFLDKDSLNPNTYTTQIKQVEVFTVEEYSQKIKNTSIDNKEAVDLKSCKDRTGNLYKDGAKIEDICKTKNNDSDYKTCISSRHFANISAICKNGTWKNL